MKKTFLFLFSLFVFYNSFSQNETKKKGTLYFSWGYNRDWFSKSTLRFINAEKNYDFTLHNVKAKDRPDFDNIIDVFLHGDFAVPQYNYRVGYYFPEKSSMGVEISFDHSKYVMNANQVLHLTGTIGSTTYNVDTLVTPGKFLHFEHTNGANFLTANFLFRKNIMQTENKRHLLSVITKSGAGLVIPKTFIILFGEALDNRFHIAGWIAAAETGFRYEYRHFFLEPTVKGAFADYLNVLALPGTKASHRFFTFEAIVTAGFQFGL